MKMKLDKTRAMEARAIVARAFRNGPIEDLHAGKVCPVCSVDPNYSRISDAEIKLLMKNAVTQVYKLLWLVTMTSRATPRRWLTVTATHGTGTIPTFSNS